MMRTFCSTVHEAFRPADWCMQIIFVPSGNALSLVCVWLIILNSADLISLISCFCCFYCARECTLCTLHASTDATMMD